MAREFKPIRFFILMALLTAIVCGVTAFYSQRAAHGHTSEERAAYAIGEKAGKEMAAPSGKLPSAAELNGIAQQSFVRQGEGEPMAWKLAFEHGYEDGFKQTAPVR